MPRPKIYTVNGFSGTIKELGDYFSINWKTIATRMRNGWTVEQATSVPVKKNPGSPSMPAINVGKYRNFPDVVEKRFGVILNFVDYKDDASAVAKVRKYAEPVFYQIGKEYRGSLIAISQDFGCPISKLKSGLRNGVTPEEVLVSEGLFGKD